MLTTNPDRQSVYNEDPSLSQFHDSNRYAQMNAKVREKSSNKKMMIVIAACCAVILACVAYMVFLFNSDHTTPAVATSISDQHFGISDDDLEMLAAEGYDGEELTDSASDFMQAFFTFDKGSVEDGDWEKSYESYIAKDGLVEIMENLLYVRMKDDWANVFTAHPYYQSKWVSNNSISWNILPTQTVNVPYCDIYATIDCTPIDKYFLNSPDLEINRYVNCYRIVFDEHGKIVSIKKLRGFMTESAVDEAAMTADKENAEKATEVERRKAEALAKEKAAAEEAERARQEAAEQEEARKAEEEAKKKAQEEEEKKKQEENKNTNSSNSNSGSSNSNSNTNGNTGTNTGSNTNTGNNGNENAGNANDNSGNGTTPPDAAPATQSEEQ